MRWKWIGAYVVVFAAALLTVVASYAYMAQQQIQSTIQLGLGEISAGQGFESQANQALVQAGQAQLNADKAYSDSLTSVFSSIAKILPAAIAAI